MLSEPDGAAGTGGRACRPSAARRAPVPAQIALFRLVATEVEADCAIRASQHAFLTPGAAITIDLYDPRIGMLAYRVGPAHPQTCRADALLTHADHEFESVFLIRGRDPVDTIAKDALDKSIFQLAGSLARPAPRATFQVNRQHEFHCRRRRPNAMSGIRRARSTGIPARHRPSGRPSLYRRHRSRNSRVLFGIGTLAPAM